MKKTISLIAGALLLASGATAQVPRVLGVWELDPVASSIPQGFPLASETRSYDLRNDGYLVNLVIRKLANGRPDFIQIASKSDGKDYPQYQSGPLAEFQVNGTQTPATYSETVIDDYSVNIIAKVGGRVNNKGVRSISADGKTMTIKVVAIAPNGQETPITLVFKRTSA
ncbi:MAG TPA: hypothetical protein VGF24_27505 [Vicinamibacterales bacterium]|jgi:hypothetical protein